MKTRCHCQMALRRIRYLVDDNTRKAHRRLWEKTHEMKYPTKVRSSYKIGKNPSSPDTRMVNAVNCPSKALLKEKTSKESKYGKCIFIPVQKLFKMSHVNQAHSGVSRIGAARLNLSQ